VKVHRVSCYRWIAARKTEGNNVRLVCRALRVSRQAHYEWRAKHVSGPGAGDIDEACLVNEIIGVHDHLDDSYGSPRLPNEPAKRGFSANEERVERHFSDYGLYTTDSRRMMVKTTIRDLWAPLSDRV